MRTIIILFLMMTLGACNRTDETEQAGMLSTLFPVAADPMLDNEGYVPALAMSFDVNVFLANFSSSESEKMNEAIEIIKLVIGTEEFKNRVLNFSYNGEKSFVDNGG